MILVVVSKLKALVKAGGLRTSAEFVEALNSKVAEIVIQAAQNCKEDGDRKTLKPKDLA
jgi:histone H3/H4